MRADLVVILALAALLLIGIFPQHVYDVPTAMFFTLALLFFQRRQLRTYACLFPLVCLNRETAILLVLLFAVYFASRLPAREYLFFLLFQLVIYAAVFAALRLAFADAPGQALSISLADNLRTYAGSPLSTALLLGLVGAVGALVARKWYRAPALMRTALLVFAPILVVMYLLVGRSFEVRVFIELVPVVAIIATS